MSIVVAFVAHSGSMAAVEGLGAGTVVLVGPDAPGFPVDLPRRSRLSERLRSLAWRTAWGRNLFRVSPFDDSRRFWRAIGKNPYVAGIVRDAQVVVAGDRDAIFSVWQMTKKPRRFGRTWSAVYGVSAARFALDNLGKST